MASVDRSKDECGPAWRHSGCGRRCAPLAALLAVALGFQATGCGGAEPTSVPRSVVLFVLDAARADHFGHAGHVRATTPNADAFAREAVRYSTVVSEAPFTFLAMASLMSARSPAESGLSGRSGGRIGESLPLLAEHAREGGFATYAYSENPFITGHFGFDRGFDHFEEAFPVAAHGRGHELAADHDTGARIEALLDRAAAKGAEPFFLYLHILRPHNPYAPPAPFAGRFGADPERRSAGSTAHLLQLDVRGPPFDADALADLALRYDENLAYADALFGDFLASLERRGLASRTIVVLTSDHGEAFGEHGRLLHSTQLFEPMLRVPLLIRIPGVAPRIDDRPVQHADLGRGLRAYFAAAHDRDAAAPLARLAPERPPDAPLFSWTNAKTHHVAARTPDRKLVLDARTLEVVAHLDLAADPDEQSAVPLDAHGHRLREGVVEKIAAWTGVPIERFDAIASTPAEDEGGKDDEFESEKRTPSSGAAEPELRARLEALGYVDDRAVE
ncbi:MAG: sulfatase [Myxococcota bacterium]